MVKRKYFVLNNLFDSFYIPELKLTPKQRIFTPKQLEIIFKELGEP